MYPVIMAGGSGTRFWPRSRDARPKQLIRIVGERTMLQHAVERITPWAPPERILVITKLLHAEETRAQLAGYPGLRVIAEPEGRDTAACIGLAAALLHQENPDAVMAAMPADSLIQPADTFCAALDEAEAVAQREHVLVTLGLRPNYPCTQYGYIERGDPFAYRADHRFVAYRVASFREKPDARTAAEYLQSGRFYWNSGAFVWRVRDILDAFRDHMPRLHQALQRMGAAFGTARQDEAVAREYHGLDRVSIDFGVMEKARNVAVLEVDYEWDDVGSWEALARLHGRDAAGNTVHGVGHLVDSRDCIVVTGDDHLVGAVGVENLVIVHSPDATLVCSRERLGDVKELVKRLREHGLERYL
jgi:mannose-1-phosphate guanylyltransferase